MALFNKTPKNNGSSASSEFDEDMIQLMARDDIQSPADMCKIEYEKAISLMKNPTPDKVRRAYDLMGNMAAQFHYLPAVMWMGDFAENVMKNDKQAVYWYKMAAEMGDGNGSRCYADMLMAGRGVEKDMKLAMHYYADAADKGVPEAAFVLGEYLRSIGDGKNALLAYQQALDGGYAPANMRIAQMKGLYQKNHDGKMS
ncbi:MAG: hypothetical protein K6A68_16010 [Clostridiales bacterium]|nr:hypothetical protein [Clostridiales bacterium]